MTDAAVTQVARPDAAGRPSWRPRLGGIRMRIVVGYVALLAAALAIAVLVTRQVLLTRLDRQIDRQLAQEIEELRLLVAGTDPTTGEPFGTDVAAIFDTFLRRSVPGDSEAFYTLVDGRPSQRSFEAPQEVWEARPLVDEWAAVTDPTRGTATTPAGPVRYLAVPLRTGDTTAGVFVVVHFPDDDRDDVLQIVRIVAVTGAIVLLVSAALAWSLAGRVLRPVRELTSTARGITDADLSGRIPVDGDDELAELGRTFNEMVDRLEVGFTTQRQFLDDVAHELRTPITIAQGHLELLGDDPAEREETVAVITDELDRMSRYVTELLLLAKAERPDFLRPGPVDLGELAASLRAKVAGLGDREWVLDAAPPPGRVAVVADGERLEQAVLNLAGNAVQHTAPGDEVGIGVDLHPGTIDGAHPVVRLWVRDTGTGVDPAVVEGLFRRHTRGAGSRAARPDGMGIGLSIVDAIARAHGGTVEVTGRPGAGATFTIVVPAAPEPDDDVAEEDTP